MGSSPSCRWWATAAMSSPGHPARRPAQGQPLLSTARSPARARRHDSPLPAGWGSGMRKMWEIARATAWRPPGAGAQAGSGGCRPSHRPVYHQPVENAMISFACKRFGRTATEARNEVHGVLRKEGGEPRGGTRGRRRVHGARARARRGAVAPDGPAPRGVRGDLRRDAERVLALRRRRAGRGVGGAETGDPGLRGRRAPGAPGAPCCPASPPPRMRRASPR